MKHIPRARRISRLTRILRGKDGAVRQPLLYCIPLLLASALALFSSTDSERVTELPAVSLSNPDEDDGMMAAYEAYARFFGLNLKNLAAEADVDLDGDNMSNWQEFSQVIVTDPLAKDTDHDFFPDGEDAVPVSRAYLPLGDLQFIRGDNDEFVEYPRPDWCLACYKSGGEWVEDMTATQSVWLATRFAWYVAASEPPDTGSLSVDLDRTVLLTNNLVYAIHYLNLGGSNSSLYLDLLDANGAVVVKDLYGNLVNCSNAAWHAVIPAEAGIQSANAVLLLRIPTAKFTNAACVHLRRGIGEVVIYEGNLYISEDGDGLDADQERQLGASDYCIDSDGDGVSDYDEVFVYHTDPTKKDDGGGDGDDDKDKNKNGIIYVDQAIGDDQRTGRTRDVAGQDGPKKTVHKGMAAVDEDAAHTLVIKSGAYKENLDIRGKNVKVVIEGTVRL